MKKQSKKKLFATALSITMLFATFNIPPVFAEESTPTPTATPTATPAEEDASIKFIPSSNLGFEKSFDNSAQTEMPKDYVFTSDTSAIGYTISKISIEGQAVRDENEVTTLGNLTLGTVEGQKEDDSWVILADFGNSATATETINISDEKISLDTTTTFKAIRYNGLTDNSTGITVNSYVSSELKLEVEFMPVVKHKVTFVDDLSGITVGYANAPDGFNLDEATAPIKTHPGYTFNALTGNTTNITADEEIHISFTVNQYLVKIHYKTTDLIDAKYDYGTKFIVLKKDGTEATSYTLDENGIDEELTPLSETGWDFVGFSYDDLTKTITPNYTIKTFTVTFVDLDGKTIDAPQTIEYGKVATAPEAPTIPGYNFISWDKAFDNITADLTVKPIYEQIKLQVYVTCNSAILVNEKLPWGSTISVLNGALTLNTKIKVEQDISQDLPIPEYLGHTFSNYTVTDDGTGSKTLTPNFVVNEYSVRFLDMYKNVLTTKRVKYGDTVIAPDAPIVRGYIFTGWDKPLTGITADEDITACYNDDPSIPKYNITFNVKTEDRNYGTLSTASVPQQVSYPVKNVIDGTLLDTIAPSPKTIGTSKFDGWYINDVKTDDLATVVADAIMTIEARFYPDTNNNNVDDRQEPVIVKFNTVNAGNIPDQNLHIGSVIVTPTIPNKSGYIFAGWYTSSSYATKWNFGDSVSQDMTLYAKWNKQVVQTPTATVSPITVPTAVPTITAKPTVTSSASGSTTGSFLTGTYSNSGQTTSVGGITSTAKPVVTINPTLYIHPTITFRSESGFLEGTETMSYGTNIFVYDGNGTKLAEYSARQDCEIVLPEPGLIKNKVFSNYHIYWDEGSLIVQYEYIKDYSNTTTPTPSATPTATDEPGTKELTNKLWMLPWFLGGIGVLGIFILLIKKLFKKDGSNKKASDGITDLSEDSSQDDEEDAEGNAEETSESEEEELIEPETYDDDMLDEAGPGVVASSMITENTDDIVVPVANSEPIPEEATQQVYKDPELFQPDIPVENETEEAEITVAPDATPAPTVTSDEGCGDMNVPVDTEHVAPPPIDDVFENILNKYAKNPIKGGK